MVCGPGFALDSFSCICFFILFLLTIDLVVGQRIEIQTVSGGYVGGYHESLMSPGRGGG